jgi:dTDP-L-rhamnose 4-epimerase
VRVVVTGGGGFIGSHVVDELVARGCDVVAVDVFLAEAHRRTPDYLNPSATYERIDVQDVTSLQEVVADADALCHHASMVGLGRSFADIGKYVANNDVGTAALLEALYRRSWRGRFVLASSMVVYGEGSYRCRRHGLVRPPPRTTRDLTAGRFDAMCPSCGNTLSPEPITEEASTDPRSIYAATKLHQEHLCATFGREARVPVAALRYHNVYGPRMPVDTPYAGVAAVFRSALEAREPAQVFEDGRQLRDFIHVSDVARAAAMCITADDPVRGCFNIGSGEAHSIGEMASELTNAFGSGMPHPRVTGRFRLGDVRHIFASSGRAESVLGWRAEIDFAIGIKEFATAPQRA